jgi:uncharacterized protein
MANVINWFEIPVTDLDRAVKFYEKLLGGAIHQQEMMEFKMGFLPMEGQGVGGALCQGPGYVPTTQGVVVYLNGGNDLNPQLSLVEELGGKVLMPKTKITDEIGYMAFFTDSEGNKMAFHSPS